MVGPSEWIKAFVLRSFQWGTEAPDEAATELGGSSSLPAKGHEASLSQKGCKDQEQEHRDRRRPATELGGFMGLLLPNVSFRHSTVFLKMLTVSSVFGYVRPPEQMIY